MGFCLINNVAVAAAHARAACGRERVLIVDWDVHHGNGTQHCFESDPSVLYFSTHRFPFYPGTGDVGETGRGAGAGFTVNVPLPAGCNDADLEAVFRRLLVPIAGAFAPDLVLVSAGFDAHARDPLGDMSLTDAGFARLCAIVAALADRHAGGRLVLVLEGGYDLAALAAGVAACVDVMGGAVPPPAAAPAAPRAAAERVIERVAAAHRAAAAAAHSPPSPGP
jgi:acetoin utilization deacetylase AcuC-like enzyme